MDSALYNRDILRLAASLISGDTLEQPDGVAEARSPLCGSRIQAEIEASDDGTIKALALRANACALGQASAAIVRANAVGENLKAIADVRKGVADALSGKSEMPNRWSELMLLAPAKDYPSRHAAILLPYDALLAAAAKMKLAS
jgi:NifU-like protein involved in Fe-S cluster formation